VLQVYGWDTPISILAASALEGALRLLEIVAMADEKTDKIVICVVVMLLVGQKNRLSWR